MIQSRQLVVEDGKVRWRVLTPIMPPAWTNILYIDAETVRVPTPPEFVDAHATWTGWTYGKPAIRVTTAK